jgi:tetratricopeptide (TPR) repeat protein
MLNGQLAEARGDHEAAAAAYQAAIGSALLARAVNYGPWVWWRPPLAGDTLPFMQQPALAESLVKAYLALGELYARQGMPSEARAAYEAVLALNPNQLEARMGLEALP